MSAPRCPSCQQPLEPYFVLFDHEPRCWYERLAEQLTQADLARQERENLEKQAVYAVEARAWAKDR
jgi:hypothetical protein